MMTATLHAWPASEVPPPRVVIGTFVLATDSGPFAITSSMVRGRHDADRDVAVVWMRRWDHGGEAAAVEADFAGDGRAAKSVARAAADSAVPRVKSLRFWGMRIGWKSTSRRATPAALAASPCWTIK